MRGEASFVRDRVRGEDEGECKVKISKYYDELKALVFHHLKDAICILLKS